MPTYSYEVIASGEYLEIEHSIHCPSLTQHPETGEAIRRVYLPPNLGLKHTPGSTQKLLSDANVAQAGFSKYQKDKLTGQYHKIAGHQGPAVL